MANTPSPHSKKQISTWLKMIGYGKQRADQHRRKKGAEPLDIIYSCCVCNATFSEVYDGPCETVKMLSDGLNPKDRIVSRLFISSCSHIFCAKHLDGGGPPFHPAGSRPQASCPFCKENVHLFSVRGFLPGEYDPAIPQCWFSTPPMKLDAKGDEMEAMAFQYQKLLDYCTRITDEQRSITRQLSEARGEIGKVQNSAHEEHVKVVELERKNNELQAAQSELQRLKSRLPAIQHYLKCIPKLVEQNELMRDRLASLGFQMHFEPLEYKEPCLLEEMEGVVGLDAVQSKTTSSYTGEKSAETLVNTDHSMSSTPRDRPLKRQRMESPIHGHNIHAIPQQRGVSSRDKMPPPAKPLLRMKSFKKLWPTLRKKASHGLASSSIGSHRQQSTEPGFGISHSENDRYDLNSEGSHMTPTLHAEDKNDDQYMTGALPVESYDSEKLSPQPIDLNGASADFTFRKPVEASSMRPAHLPSEPSYIRLLDGLSNDTGLDLGITDPRSEYLEEYEQRERDLAIAKAWAAQPLNPDGSPRWCLFEALDQHAMGSSSPAPRHPDPLRSNPIKRPTSSTRAIRSTNRTLPATPAPQRSQQHAGMEESVVSPFFKSSNCSSRNLRRAGVNQRGDSSRRNSGAYPYQRQQTPNVRTGRGEGRSLNVLSFFNSPLNTRNEPILHHTGYVETNPFTTSERRYAASNVTANGYIKRPDREPVKENSFLNALGRNGYILPSSTTSFAARALPPKRTVVSRPAPLSASVQSIVSSQHGGRRSRGGYIHSGIRSSRISLAPRNSFHDNPYAGTEHNIFSSCGRRTIRR